MNNFYNNPNYDLKHTDLQQRYHTVYQRLPSHAQLLCVSKTQPATAIRQLYELGQRDFGENYLQEALTKIHELQDLPIVWHYIGHIQRNKTRDIAAYFDWVHGVDRLIIAERLNQQRALACHDDLVNNSSLNTHLNHNPSNTHLSNSNSFIKPLNICIQVNIDNEASKSGCSIGQLPSLIEQVSRLPNLNLRGLMIIPDPTQDSRAAFAKVKQLFDDYQSLHDNPSVWDTLSMGMSADMDSAIAHGATMVRVGTAIFGRRG